MNKQILKHVIRYILMICIIMIGSIIFGFSAENGDKSASTSTKVARFIVIHSEKIKSEEQINREVEMIQPIIRKIAHFSIYTLLGFCIMGCAATYKGSKIIKFDISVIISFLYACTDEWHQSFIPGRSAQFSDVCLDTLGAFLGIMVILIAIWIYEASVKRSSKKIKTLAEENKKSTKKRSVCFIASTGGHLNELLQVKPLFKNYNYNIITEKTKVDDSLKEEYGNRIHFLIYGTKKYPIRYIFKFIANSFISLYYFFRYQPEVIVTTGTHTAVPMCYIAKIFGSKVIFIETFANRTTGTVAGRLVYPIADTFVVQWEELHKVYPKSVCWGWIY